MKIVIERNMPVLKVKRALEILIAEDDLVADYLNKAEIRNNVVLKIEKDEGRVAKRMYVTERIYNIKRIFKRNRKYYFN